MWRHILAWCLTLLMAASRVDGISQISVKGTKLYDEDGNQFFMKGVAYQFENIKDPLINTSKCQLDAGLIKDLGANTIRVYAVDGTQSHDGCMQAFASQGIYVWLDLPSPYMAFNRNTPEWSMEMFSNFSGTIDAFAGYDNVLAFTTRQLSQHHTSKQRCET
ncbi:putative glycolipid-anchored surface protein [Eutypa lata UCREL1]|uniref:1,3-beta-glucanosyltransferase n=1 Tax=Eutypa lata (strain UCR-EL1) TaxID=1287681 RepID=M7SHK9_EUTLA|nr:putative glycolipid-anchored surface protein [Eutypa lata UCREL1]